MRKHKEKLLHKSLYNAWFIIESFGHKMHRGKLLKILYYIVMSIEQVVYSSQIHLL